MSAATRRVRDVIDVNRRWGIWRGDREFAHRIGAVAAPDRLSARRAAREQFTGRFYVEEERW